MAGKLKATFAATVTEPGRHGDGGGLYLLVKPSGAKSWVLLPNWTEKAETARRVRQRISAVMRWSIAQGYRTDNPAGEAIAAAFPKVGEMRRHF